jgi:GH3 auxin-responsive promoter
MKADAAVANAAWFAASLPEWARYRRAATNVEAMQRTLLRSYLRNNAATEFGKLHQFARIPDWETYAERVPLRNYEDFHPWVERIASGSPNVLTAERVELLEPTSGSSGTAKWVPYTRTLQAEFRRAVAVWIAQNFLDCPDLMGGRAYWSVTPQVLSDRTPTQVPVGFDDDSAYLGGITRRLIDRTMVTSPALRRIVEMQQFWRTSLLLLLKCRDLRLISVWHPSYIVLLLRHMRAGWSQLLEDLKSGLILTAPPLSVGADPSRARELEGLGPDDPGAIWPALRLISCWGDAHAAGCIKEVRDAFPRTPVQPKGLIATEAFVTLPLGEFRPLAIRSHFFEFIDEDGKAHSSWALDRGRVYSVVVTTGGGLYRYRLKDRVEVTGYFNGIPGFRFLGKEDNVTDFRGEKLAEAFVTAALDAVFARNGLVPRFAMVAMDNSGSPPGYTLYLECSKRCTTPLDTEVESELRRNFHYELCIRLGQLRPVRVLPIECRAYEIYSRVLTDRGMRLGDIKPTSLSPYTDWSRHFAEVVRR